jgi:hypothetical protein
MLIKSRAIGMFGLALLLSACGQSGKPSGDKSPGPVSGAINASVPVAPPAALDPAPVPDDCNRKIAAAAAAAILGVGKVKENVYFGHTKQPPDQMDVLECGYHKAGPDPYAPFLKFVMFTPGAADIASVYSSMPAPSGMQTIDTHVGMSSSGWIRPGAGPGLFEAHVTFRTASNIFQVIVGGQHGADAATNAALKLAGSL